MSTLRNEFYIKGNENCNVPAHLNFSKLMLDRLRLMRDKVALENGVTGEKITYREITQYAVDLSLSLSKLGIGKGDVVALGAERSIYSLPTALAIVFTGATYTPYEVECGSAVLKHKLGVARPNYFIISKLFWDTNKETIENYGAIKMFISYDGGPESAVPIDSLLENHADVDRFEPAEVKGQSDVALILYSSGTTGMPKGIQLTHLNLILISSSDGFLDDRFGVILVKGQWFHIGSIFLSLKFLFLGRKTVYLDNFEPEIVLKCMQDCKVDLAMMIPSSISLITMFEDYKNYNIDTVKVINSSTFPIHVKTMEKVLQMFPHVENIMQIYMMTEIATITSDSLAMKPSKLGSVGTAYPGVIIKVVDPKTEEPLGPNVHGEIRVKGPALMKGYIGLDPSTYLDGEGFFKTGDLGYYDEDNYFYIVDRLKEIISVDGLQIAPVELEVLLLQHPAVRDAAVVGKPVPIYGEECAAFVVKKHGADVTEQELADYIAPLVYERMHLTGGVRFISEIPRNLTGKILRRQLRDLLQ